MGFVLRKGVNSRRKKTGHKMQTCKILSLNQNPKLTSIEIHISDLFFFNSQNFINNIQDSR